MTRHKFLGIALSTLTLLLVAESAHAQFGFGRGGRGWGGYGGNGYGNNWSGNNWYGSGYSSSGWGSPYYNSGAGYNNYYGNGGYHSPYNYGWNSNYYSYPSTYSWGNSAAPVYSGTPYASPLVSGNYSSYDGSQASGGYQSFYSGPSVSANQVLIRIVVPAPDARVWIEGQPTQQSGLERFFLSPTLEPGNYTYTIRSTWMENGREVNRQKQVSVRPGQEFVVRFNEGDNTPATTTTTSTTTTTGTGTTGTSATGTSTIGTSGTGTSSTGTTTPSTTTDSSGTIRNPLTPSTSPRPSTSGTNSTSPANPNDKD